MKSCVQCGKRFDPYHPVVNTCSEQCKAERKATAAFDAYGRRVGIFVESVNPYEIHRAHGWICYLCKMPMRRDVTNPHPLSPAMDHIVSLAHGGEHRRSNCAPVHLSCNSRKSHQPMRVLRQFVDEGPAKFHGLDDLADGFEVPTLDLAVRVAEGRFPAPDITIGLGEDCFDGWMTATVFQWVWPRRERYCKYHLFNALERGEYHFADYGVSIENCGRAWPEKVWA